jgi:hypothetical protein
MDSVQRQLVKQHSDFFKTLPDKYMDAITNYTFHYGTALGLNILLQSGKQITDPETLDILNGLDYVFDKIPPLETSLTVYRGIDTKSPEDMQINNLSFISTTYNKKVTYNFTGKCCIIILTIPVGSKVLFLESISKYPTEREVLLDRGGSFAITGVILPNDEERHVQILASYIPKNSQIGVSHLSESISEIQKQISNK